MINNTRMCPLRKKYKIPPPDDDRPEHRRAFNYLYENADEWMAIRYSD